MLNLTKFTMKKALTVLMSALVLFSCEKKSDESTLVLQPGPDDGIDAVVWNISPDMTYPHYPELNSLAWTYQLTPCFMWGFLKFDLSEISSDKNINRAELYLYGFESTNNGASSSLTGANHSILCRITESWEPETVSWSNQPSFVTTNAVLIDSCNTIENYVIDVTEHVRDMVQNPSANYGWILKQQNEAFYRKMIFASSDHENEALRPKLVIEID
jgi:hypothetical protein